MDTIEIATVITSATALIVSVIALVYTAKTYLLKSGSSIKGYYAITSSMACEDRYVSSVALQNLKDRSTAIFEIFLLVGRNYYLSIEKFDNPLILEPFSVYSKSYDPVEFYSVSMRRYDLNNLLSCRKRRPKLVLSTSDGKYFVKKPINKWEPYVDFFQNHMTGVVHPIRLQHKNKSYGSNAKYIVEFKTNNGREEVVPIYPEDSRLRKFKKFNLTTESLDSREALELFLIEQADKGNLSCADITVHDVDKWRQELYRDHGQSKTEAKYNNWFSYRVVGRALTLLSDYRLRKKNKKVQKQRQENAT